MRARNTGVLGAAGLAATLVSALGDNPWYVIAIVPFVLSTIYAVKSMGVLRIRLDHPVDVVSKMVNQDSYNARREIIKSLSKEYDEAERNYGIITRHTQTAMGWFIAGTAMVLLVSLVPALVPIFGSGEVT